MYHRKTDKKVLVKFEGRKNAKKVGYAVEYDCVHFLRDQGCFAQRNPSYNQTGEMRCVDVIYYNPATKTFGFIQCKRRRKYLHKEEKDRILTVARKYGAVAELCFRDRGLIFEILE